MPDLNEQADELAQLAGGVADLIRAGKWPKALWLCSEIRMVADELAGAILQAGLAE